MDAVTPRAVGAQRFTCRRVVPSRPAPSLAEDARAGLLEPPRSLPPKYFYDERGSRLFDRICNTPEYYPTRTEEALLERWAGEIIAATRPEQLLELGSGTSRKTRHLLDACQAAGLACRYRPFDVCEAMLRESGARLLEAYPWLRVEALVGDYNAGLARLPDAPGRCLFVFLGGTIGNFEPAQARTFLAELRARMRPGDALLLGADRVKDPDVLRAAYNDAAGVTAQFNLNVLQVLNRELDADFDPSAYRHLAEYNRRRRRVEMYLIARRPQRVRLGALGAEFRLAAGERILTEISRKFALSDLRALLAGAGLALARHYSPANGYYSLLLARPR